jgi:hypothetical protein
MRSQWAMVKYTISQIDDNIWTLEYWRSGGFTCMTLLSKLISLDHMGPCLRLISMKWLIAGVQQKHHGYRWLCTTDTKTLHHGYRWFAPRLPLPCTTVTATLHQTPCHVIAGNIRNVIPPWQPRFGNINTSHHTLVTMLGYLVLAVLHSEHAIPLNNEPFPLVSFVFVNHLCTYMNYVALISHFHAFLSRIEYVFCGGWLGQSTLNYHTIC